MKKKIELAALAITATMIPSLLTLTTTNNNQVLLTTTNSLSKQSIKVTNVWNYPIFDICFNSNNTFKILNGGSYTNPYYQGNNSLILNITNSNGKIIYNKEFKGGAYPYSELNQELSNQKFAIGDRINLTSNSGAHFISNNQTTTKSVCYEITNKGLVTLNNNIRGLKAQYSNNVVNVSGITTANTIVYIWGSGTCYETTSNTNGSFNINLPNSIKPGDKISALTNNSKTASTTVTLNDSVYKLAKTNITLYGADGSVYKVANIGFNPYNMTISASSTQTWGVMDGYTKNVLYTFNLFNSSGKELLSKNFLGGLTGSTMASEINGTKFNYGDYFEIIPHSISASLNNSPATDNPIFGRLTKDGFKSLVQPTLTVNNNILNVASNYPNSKALITLNGKNYSATTDSKGNLSWTIPNGTAINSPISVKILANGTYTMPVTAYSSFINNSNSFEYNMFRYASYSPSSKIALKGNDMSLTSFEPIPLQFSSKSSVTIDVKGNNIKGSAAIYFNNGYGQSYLKTIPVNKATTLEVPGNGAIIVDTGNVDYDGAQNKGFSFKTDVTVNNGYYRSIPVFDNRTNIKIDNNATNNSSVFLNEITNPSNANHGSVIIGNHVRMYIPDSETSLPNNFNAANTVNLYNEAFISDNELNGLSENATNQLNKFHTNFFYLYPDSAAESDGWFTDGDGTFAIPSMFKVGLTTPGWVMFHEVGHIFDPDWADSYGGCEVYSNMYTQETQLKIQGYTSWLYDGLNPSTVTNNILPIFQNYYEGNLCTTPYLHDFSTGLYYYTLLKQYYPNFMEETDDLYRTEWYNNSLPYHSIDFLVYAMANIYHTNIIPSLEMWGYNVTNQSLINYVINNSKDTTNLVPKLNSFNSYKNKTVAPTTTIPTTKDGKTTITGMVNPNSTVYVNYMNKNYNTTCNTDGKFSITFPAGTSKSATIWAISKGKSKSLVQNLTVDGNYTENNKTIWLNACDSNGGNQASFSLNSNGTLHFVSQQAEPNWTSSSNNPYMTIKIISNTGQTLYSFTEDQKTTFDKAESVLNNMKLEQGDVIEIISPDEYNGTQVQESSISNSSKKTLTSTIDNCGCYWKILVTANGLEQLTPPTLNISYGEKTFVTNTIPDTKLTLLIKGKDYSTVANENGEVTINLPNNLQGGQSIPYALTLNNKTLFTGNTTVSGINSKIDFENVWYQNLGSLIFNYNTMELSYAWGGAEVNPYLNGEAFDITIKDKNGNIIKEDKINGGEIGYKTLPEVANIKMDLGSTITINRVASTNITVNNYLNENNEITNGLKVLGSMTFKVTNNGLILENNNLLNKNSKSNKEKSKSTAITTNNTNTNNTNTNTNTNNNKTKIKDSKSTTVRKNNSSTISNSPSNPTTIGNDISSLWHDITSWFLNIF